MSQSTPRRERAKFLRYSEGLTYKEIGDMMGITRQAAHLLVNPDRQLEYQRSRYSMKNVKRRKDYNNNG